jgi:catechol 2,3-dioxygenase-like lactoylglutathione lyase family enzyme
MPPTSPDLAVRVQSHVSIGTDDLARSRAFYRALFDAEPVLEKPDYVRFWPQELGLVLGLNLQDDVQDDLRRDAGHGTGPLQHLGLLFPDAAALRAARARLDAAGFASHGAERTECCYAELDQFWARDPSGVAWELFLAHRTEVEPEPSPARTCCAPSCCP